MPTRIPRTSRFLTPPLGLALVLCLALMGCGGDPAAPGADPSSSGKGVPAPPGVTGMAPPGAVPRGPRPALLVTLDTTRADRLAPYGGDVPTPTLGALAAAGVTFERTRAVTPVTLPSHATLLTGLAPPRHRVRNNGIHRLDERFTTLAEVAAAAGWPTAAFVSAAVLERRYGLAQGFATYDDDLTGGRRELRSIVERTADATVDAARRWLDGQLEAPGPFLLWVHLFDPHAPYAPPETAPGWDAGAPAVAGLTPYDREVAFLDTQLGRLLEHPALADAVVAVVGDHGESLGEHGEATHGMLVYEGTMAVPFLLRIPGGPAGLRVATPVSQVDLAPTLLELLGLTPGQQVTVGEDLLDLPARDRPDGVSLLPLLEGEDLPPRDLYGESHVAFHAYGWARLHTLWRGSDKYIDAPAPELYDLAEDPAEEDNRITRAGERARELETALRQHLEVAGATASPDDPPADALARDREAEEKLRSLGYLPAGGRRPADAPRPDPKAVISVHEDLQRVGVLLQGARWDEAVRLLRGVLRRDPQNPAALRDLGQALGRLGRLDDAVVALERALALDPADATLLLALADLEARRDRPQQALALAEQAVAADPLSQEAKLERARFLAALGRADEARQALATAAGATGTAANNPWVELRRAELIDLPAGDLAAAERRLRSVVERDPQLEEAWIRLGDVLERREAPAEAREVYRRALRVHPRNAELHARLGSLLASAGEPAAEDLLERALELDPSPRPRVLQNLAALALSRQQWAEAERWAEKAVAVEPSSAAAWNTLGIAREEQGRLPRAEEAYSRALEADGAYWQASFNLGLLLRGRQRYPEAAAAFRRVLEHQPTHAAAHFELGMLHAGPLGDPQAARRHLQAAIQAAPQHPRSARAREVLAGLG